MKVKDLITQLQEFDGDTEVLMSEYDSDLQEWDYSDLGIYDGDVRIVTDNYGTYVPSDSTRGKVQNIVSIRRY